MSILIPEPLTDANSHSKEYRRIESIIKNCGGHAFGLQRDYLAELRSVHTYADLVIMKDIHPVTVYVCTNARICGIDVLGLFESGCPGVSKGFFDLICTKTVHDLKHFGESVASFLKEGDLNAKS